MASSQTHSDLLKRHAIWIALGCSLLATGVILVPSAKPFWFLGHVLLWLLAAIASGAIVRAARTRAPAVDHLRVAVLVALLPLWGSALLPFFGCLGAIIVGFVLDSSRIDSVWTAAVVSTIIIAILAGLSKCESWRHVRMLALGPVAAVVIALFERDFDRGVALVAIAMLAAILLDRAWNLQRILNIPPPGHCPECGYDLKGAVAPVCPECGADTNRPVVCQHCSACVMGLRSRTCWWCGERARPEKVHSHASDHR